MLSILQFSVGFPASVSPASVHLFDFELTGRFPRRPLGDRLRILEPPLFFAAHPSKPWLCLLSETVVGAIVCW